MPTATSTPTPSPTSTATPAAVAARIQGFAFSPATLTIARGTTVVWTQSDGVPHTVTSDSGSELNSTVLGQGQTYSHTFTQAGTFAYHCDIHPSMQAQVIVQ